MTRATITDVIRHTQHTHFVIEMTVFPVQKFFNNVPRLQLHNSQHGKISAANQLLNQSETRHS